MSCNAHIHDLGSFFYTVAIDAVAGQPFSTAIHLAEYLERNFLGKGGKKKLNNKRTLTGFKPTSLHFRAQSHHHCNPIMYTKVDSAS